MQLIKDRGVVIYSQMLLYALGLLVVTVVAHRLIYRSSSMSTRGNAKGGSNDHMRLVGVCFGDKAKAMRLTDYEQSRAPNISRPEAIKRALERLQEDRR